jgi:flavin reductase ActVB
VNSGTIDPDQLFRDAMAAFPSGVTIVTTTDASNRWWGFTATSFCSVSVDPPLVLTCLATSAECHPIFEQAGHWLVHIIHSDHADLAKRFAMRGADKFSQAGFAADAQGLPILDDSAVALRCAAFARHPAGDHTILVGRVEETRIDDAKPPALYFRRAFRSLEAVS